MRKILENLIEKILNFFNRSNEKKRMVSLKKDIMSIMVDNGYLYTQVRPNIDRFVKELEKTNIFEKDFIFVYESTLNKWNAKNKRANISRQSLSVSGISFCFVYKIESITVNENKSNLIRFNICL